jgi:hypothetical protein
MRALRTLAPVRLTDARLTDRNQRIRRTAFVLGLLALILEFALSGQALTHLGIGYTSPDGSLLTTLHPATYLVSIATLMVLMQTRPFGSGLFRLWRDTPALALFILLVFCCACYGIADGGFSGAAAYVESYLSAGFLAVALEGGTDRQKRALAWWIVALCGLSIILAVAESATETHLIPLQAGDGSPAELAADPAAFRSAGLFGHPLTAALTTSMATFLVLRMRMNGLLKATLFTAFLIGLLSFGGRTALAATSALILLAAGVLLLRGVVMRNLAMGAVVAGGAAILILPPLLLLVMTGTDIGEHVATYIYPAEITGTGGPQWLVLNHLNLRDILFGVSPMRLDILSYQLNLGHDTTDIDNVWLLTFLNLGAIGFFVLLFALGLFLMHLGRTTANPLGWMLLVAAVMIDATAHSPDRESADLFFMAACMIAMSGYSRTAPTLSLQLRPLNSPRQTSGRRTSDRLGTRPSHANLAGLRS